MKHYHLEKANVFVFIFKEGYTLESVAKQMGVTRERVRQIIAKGLRRLKHPSRIKYLRYGKELL